MKKILLCAALALLPSLAFGQVGSTPGITGGGISVVTAVRASDGSVSAPGYAFTSQPNTGFYIGTSRLNVSSGSNFQARFDNGVAVPSNNAFKFLSGTSEASSPDVGFQRGSTSTVFVTDGGAGAGQFSAATILGVNALGGGTVWFLANSAGTHVDAGREIGWSGTAGNAAAAADAGFARLAAGVSKPTDGAGGGGWMQMGAGRVMLASDYTNATATFTNVSLTITVKTGRKYTFRIVMHAIESVAADGIAIDFSAGSATATNLRLGCVLTSDTGANVAQANAVSVAFGTVVNATALATTNQHLYTCEGTFEPSSNGTFQMRARQNTHSTGTLTIARGSYMSFEDMP